MFAGLIFMGGDNVIDQVNGAYFEFWEVSGIIFFVLAALYVLPAILNVYEWYKVHYESEMNT